MNKALSRLLEFFGAEKPSDADQSNIPPAVDISELEEKVRRLRNEGELAREERRRWLVGNVLLAHAQTQPELDAYLRALLDYFLDDPRDRQLFELDGPEPEIPPFHLRRVGRISRYRSESDSDLAIKLDQGGSWEVFRREEQDFTVHGQGV